MPSRSELPSDLKRKKFIRALQRLGFIIDKSGGNGSHYKVMWPTTQKVSQSSMNLEKTYFMRYLKKLKSVAESSGKISKSSFDSFYF